MSDSLSVPNPLLLPSKNDPESYAYSPRASEQFLRFHLMPDMKSLLPIQQVTEVLTIPSDQIVPIFHMPPWVMGVYNWRGEILWMVDLGHLVGLTASYQEPISSSTYQAVVLQARSNPATSTKVKSQMLGLIVNRVEDIEWCTPDSIQSPPSSTVTPELVPFLRGYWLKSSGEILVVMDGQAIIAAMPKSSPSADT